MERRLERKNQQAQAQEELFLSSSTLLGEDRGTVLMSERGEKGDANGERRELLKRKEGAGRERLTEERALEDRV